MIVLDRPVRFEDVDAAGIVFFPRYLSYCHDAMERLFDAVPGGYVALITRRRIGFPAVHVESDFAAPLRYGDAARIEASVTALGTTSCKLRYAMSRAGDGVHVATVVHVTVSTNLQTMEKLPHPADVRAALEAHLSAPPG
jgi:4-hydroxybenzoyl-CoA thioesterase